MQFNNQLVVDTAATTATSGPRCHRGLLQELPRGRNPRKPVGQANGVMGRDHYRPVLANIVRRLAHSCRTAPNMCWSYADERWVAMAKDRLRMA